MQSVCLAQKKKILLLSCRFLWPDLIYIRHEEHLLVTLHVLMTSLDAQIMISCVVKPIFAWRQLIKEVY